MLLETFIPLSDNNTTITLTVGVSALIQAHGIIVISENVNLPKDDYFDEDSV